MHRAAAIWVALFTWTPPALAQDAPQPAPSPSYGHDPGADAPGHGPEEADAPAAEPDAPEPDRLGPGEGPSDVRFVDAAADRVGLFSTAETHPEGTLFFSDYELLLLQAGYALTDSVQVALTGVPPVLDGQHWFLDLTVKGNIVRSEHIRAALLGSVVGVFDGDGESAWGARLGAVAQLCFDSDCWSSLSVNTNAFVTTSSYLPVLGAIGLVGRLSELVALYLEPAYMLVIGERDVFGVDGMLLTYGMRLSGTRWAVDVALLKPIGQDLATGGPFLFGVPGLALTYRTDGSARRDGSAPPAASTP